MSVRERERNERQRSRSTEEKREEQNGAQGAFHAAERGFLCVS